VAYTEAYCAEDWGAENGDQRPYDELEPAEQERVFDECADNLRDISEGDRETFLRCLGCLQDCSYAHRCLGQAHGSSRIFSDDCPDADAS